MRARCGAESVVGHGGRQTSSLTATAPHWCRRVWVGVQLKAEVQNVEAINQEDDDLKDPPTMGGGLRTPATSGLQRMPATGGLQQQPNRPQRKMRFRQRDVGGAMAALDEVLKLEQANVAVANHPGEAKPGGALPTCTPSGR